MSPNVDEQKDDGLDVDARIDPLLDSPPTPPSLGMPLRKYTGTPDDEEEEEATESEEEERKGEMEMERRVPNAAEI